MKLSFSRRTAVALAATALLIAALVPAAAFASDPGSEPSNPITLSSTLPWAQATTGTMVPYEYSQGKTDYELFYQIYLTKGQTVSLNASISPASSAAYIDIYPREGAYDFDQWADWYPGDMRADIRFMAPRAGYYIINPFCDNTPLAYSMTIEPASVPKYSLGSLSMSTSKPKKQVAFTIGVKVNAEYDGFTSPITFAVQQLTGKKWHTFHTYKGRLGDLTTTWTKFRNPAVVLPKGTFRVRAEFADATHPVKQMTSYKQFSVK